MNPTNFDAMTTEFTVFSATLPQTNDHREICLARVQLQFHQGETELRPTHLRESLPAVLKIYRGGVSQPARLAA